MVALTVRRCTDCMCVSPSSLTPLSILRSSMSDTSDATELSVAVVVVTGLVDCDPQRHRFSRMTCTVQMPRTAFERSESDSWQSHVHEARCSTATW